MPLSAARQLQPRLLDTVRELIQRGHRDPAASEAETERLSAIVGDLRRGAVASRRRSDSRPGGRVQLDDTEIVERAHAYVVAMVRVPSLRVTRVASALGISVRRLHVAFTNHDSTIARLILETRLVRARLDLATLCGHRGAVSIVSTRWGFATPASFSRAFRREYGVSPGAWMRAEHPELVEETAEGLQP